MGWQPTSTAPKNVDLLVDGEDWDAPTLAHWSGIYEAWLNLSVDLVQDVCAQMSEENFMFCFAMDDAPSKWIPIIEARDAHI